MMVTHRRRTDAKGHRGDRGGGRENSAQDRGAERDEFDNVKIKTEKEMEVPASPKDVDCQNLKDTNGG